MYFFDDNYFEIQKYGVKEGGVARNTAWIRFLKTRRDDVKYVNFKITHRIFKYLNYLYFWFKCSTIHDEKVFMLYPKVGLPVLGGDWKGKMFRKLFLSCMSTLKKHNNEVIFDISDIKYEQAVDLELSGLDMDGMRDFEKRLFSLGQKYVFASYSMREYAVKTHGIPMEHTDVCINGGTIRESSGRSYDALPGDKLKYVYAGTLNKGRMIEQMIDVFPDNEKSVLILMGSNGEWINKYLREIGKKGVRYLGAFEEWEAREIVSQCDVGVIPYDDTRLYYNIAYPTKLSFYITAGLPFISTPVSEVKKVLAKYDIGYMEKLADWADKVNTLTKEDIETTKQEVKKAMPFFTWEKIFSDCTFI